MPKVTLDKICKSFGHVQVLNNLDLAVRAKELVVVLGITGCGKTTMLNIIAGLTKQDQGDVYIDDLLVNNTPPEKRPIGVVFQDHQLFPHLNAYKNIAFGLEAMNIPRKMIERIVQEKIELFGIDALIKRYPHMLSGGEKQRVALARALAIEPEVLLLDEPFNNLDPRTAKHLRLELRRIQRQLGVTCIFVTHNLSESEELSDRIAIISNGKIQQVGTPQEIFFSPINSHVHEFLGAPNIFECESCSLIGNDLAEVKSNNLSIVAPYDGKPIKRLSILPSEIFISRYPIPGPQVNVFKGKITRINQSDTLTNISVNIENHEYQVEAPIETCKSQYLTEGSSIFVKMRLRSIKTSPDTSNHFADISGNGEK
jgi:ABC-type Fe3+/spermidine/putrescine transport system ATPase subunit